MLDNDFINARTMVITLRLDVFRFRILLIDHYKNVKA
jgi:hypothetical protein